jgi:2-polyprenyl-3-methyl-5-hydroxy-6-metoxy-1,4-benzoquinol methylase
MAWSERVPVNDDTRSRRRTGDSVSIPGGYQHLALTQGPPVQRFWHRTKLSLLDWMFEVNDADRVLDVGCGSGVFADALASRGAEVVAVDANPDAIRYAQSTFARPGLSFSLGLLDELQLPDASFDKVTCLEIVEHVYLHQVHALLRSLFKLLKPGGRVLITTPNYHGLWPAIEWATDRFSKVAKMDGDQHVTHFNRELLLTCLQNAGFSVEKLRTFSTFAPFVAGASERAAVRLERLERQVDLPFGNLLAAVARKD